MQQPSWLQNTYGINQQDYMDAPYNNSFAPPQYNSTSQNPFGNIDVQSLMGYGKGGMDIFGGINQYLNQNKAMDVVNKQLKFQKGIYNDNRMARNNFVNTTRNAFGSPNQLS